MVHDLSFTRCTGMKSGSWVGGDGSPLSGVTQLGGDLWHSGDLRMGSDLQLVGDLWLGGD